jgi:hypothetical protein
MRRHPGAGGATLGLRTRRTRRHFPACAIDGIQGKAVFKPALGHNPSKIQADRASPTINLPFCPSFIP